MRGENVIFENWIQKCQEHQNLSDQALLDAVSAHNKSFKAPKTIEDKRTEKRRIRLMGAVTKR